MKLPDHKTKIVCTIGPASATQEVMEQMLLAGMNVARLNFSHGAFDSHRKVIDQPARRRTCHGQAPCDHGRPLRAEDAYRPAQGGTGGAEAGRCAGADGR